MSDSDPPNEPHEPSAQPTAEWVESISRELGSLLGAILGWCEILIEEQAGPLNPRQREYLVNIWRSGLRGAQFVRTLTPPKPPTEG